MRNYIIALLAFSSLTLSAQNFEGTITWALKMQSNNTERQKKTEQAKKGGNGVDKSKEIGDSSKMVGMPTAMMMTVKDKNAFTKFEGGKDRAFLYLNDKKTTYLIEHQRKAFRALPQTEKMPPNAAGQAAKFVKSNETATILNYACTKYTKSFTDRGHQVTHEVWATNEISDLDLKALTQQRVGPFLVPFDKIDGVPLKIVVTNRKGIFTMLATEVSRMKVDDSLLAIPKDYKDVKARNEALLEKEED